MKRLNILLLQRTNLHYVALVKVCILETNYISRILYLFAILIIHFKTLIYIKLYENIYNDQIFSLPWVFDKRELKIFFIVLKMEINGDKFRETDVLDET